MAAIWAFLGAFATMFIYAVVSRILTALVATVAYLGLSSFMTVLEAAIQAQFGVMASDVGDSVFGESRSRNFRVAVRDGGARGARGLTEGGGCCGGSPGRRTGL